MVNLILRDVTLEDLPIFFEHQSDPVSYEMAGFKPRDHDAFMKHWEKILANPASVIKTIVVDGQTAGNVLTFIMNGKREIGYWLGKEYWGRGIATQALKQFLLLITERPLYAYVIKNNVASQRILEKCGFEVIGEDDEGYKFLMK